MCDCSELAFASHQFSGEHHDLANSGFLCHRVVSVANRRRVRQCHAAAAALLWVMGRREAGLLVILRRLHLRYAVTRGLVCATKPSSPPRVTLTLYRPFRTILQRIDCLLHVRYRDGARVTDILAYLCSTLPEHSGNKNGPFAFASRPKYYRSRPLPYPRLQFGLRAYDTYRENATRSPCSSLVLRRSYSGNHSSRRTAVEEPQQ